MPELPVESICSCADFDDYDCRIIFAAFTSRGAPAGLLRLRASKPYKRIESAEQGYANYVWRMLCFDLVGSGKHACMPVCAEFEVWEGYEHVAGPKPKYGCDGYDEWKDGCRKRRDILDELVGTFESKLPAGAMKGIIRWGKALGMI
jgi:hypothetical protein